MSSSVMKALFKLMLTKRKKEAGVQWTLMYFSSSLDGFVYNKQDFRNPFIS